MNIYSAMALLFALQIKHLIADFLFQPARWFSDKHLYVNMGGLVHATLHGLLSFLILYGFTRDATLSLILSSAESIVHFHIDWIKAGLSFTRGWKADQHIYWAAFGSDQALHHITYIGMVIAVDYFI